MKPMMLIVLDGFGVGKEYDGNAAYLANTPVIDELKKSVPSTTLQASGEYVGLPDGQMGNSEVGHLNIGAGRVIFQDLSRINKEISDGEFFHNKVLVGEMESVKKSGRALHLMGLVSHGGVHSHMEHLKALLKLAKLEGIEKVYVHAILDGRDVAPDSGREDLRELQRELDIIGVGEIVTVSGRYWAMDRDRRWERTMKYYNLLTIGEGEAYSSVDALIDSNYHREIYDEFVEPGKVKDITLEDGDSVIFFNFRPDRARQIVRLLSDDDFSDALRAKYVHLNVVSMTQYDSTLTNVTVAYGEFIPSNTLGEVLAKNGKSQLRIAETEKYAHVTFFLNGGREVPFENEDRILVQSPKVATYDLKPEMSAYEVTEKLIPVMGDYDFIMLNFANTDMVGHTGSIPAAIKAVETVDECLGKIIEQLKILGGAAIITADHGNCEVMLDDNGKPVTSHTTNVVPMYLVGVDRKLHSGALADLAPTVLEIMNIEQPIEMTGKSLLEENV